MVLIILLLSRQNIYLLYKTHKRLFDVPGRTVIANCGTYTEKVSECLDYHLLNVIKRSKSYIKDIQDYLEKSKDLGKVPSNAILVTADVVGHLYPSIPREAGLKALYKKLEERVGKKTPLSDLVIMAEFLLKNDYLEFDSNDKKQIPSTSIEATFAPSYACIFMDKVKR